MIRQALINDYPSVKDCAKAAFEPYAERMGKEPVTMQADFISHIRNNHLHVFELQNAVVAYVVFYLKGDHVLLDNIAVHPTHSGHGYGKQLIQFVETAAGSYQVPTVELYTNVLMTESIALYLSLGYQEFDRRTEDGFDRLFFRKTVTPTHTPN